MSLYRCYFHSVYAKKRWEKDGGLADLPTEEAQNMPFNFKGEVDYFDIY